MDNREKTLTALLEHDKKGYIKKFIDDINTKSLEKVKEETLKTMAATDKAMDELIQNAPLEIIGAYTACYTSMRIYTLIMALKEEGYQIYNKIHTIKNE